MAASPGLYDHLRYRFDNFMSRGGSSIFVSLMVVFATLLIIFACVRGAFLFMTTRPLSQDEVRARIAEIPFDAPDAAQREAEIRKRGGPKRLQFEGGLLRQTYITFLQMTDPGNMNHDVESNLLFKVSAVLAGLSGVVMLSMLIAFITTTLDQKIAALKKGHSRVIEEGHTLILGWNERVVEILRELIIANESERDACVVILSSVDKEEMDDYLALHLRNTKTTRIVTRSGSESSLVNLEIASVSTSKSVIILAACNASATADEKSVSDSIAIKSVLAVIASRPTEVQLSIVVELFMERNRRVVDGISPNEITTIDGNEVLAKILVQTSRSAGLSLVYAEIMSFDGCEMYFHHDKWSGISWRDFGFHFPDGVPMGIRRPDGNVVLRPPLDEPVSEDDEILILAEDDSTIHFQSKPVVNAPQPPAVAGSVEPRIERELIIGWTEKCETILREYAEYTLDGSSVDIILREKDESVTQRIQEIDAELPGLDIGVVHHDPLDANELRQCEPFNYNNIIILSQSDSDESDAERTDSETIIILLLLRNIFEEYPEQAKGTKLITEVLDSENQPLVARTGVNDFIISNQVVSCLLAQVSEDRDIALVYDDLFQEDGSEIYLKPMHLYYEHFPVIAPFGELMRAAHNRDEICLGLKIKSLERDGEQNYGVKLIPEKNVEYTLGPDDCLVVLAEDDT